MEKDKKNKPKQNRSSIIRIILSNYDMIGIKELKILYQKQGGVDTFNLESYIDLNSRKVITKSFKVKAKEINRYSFLYNTEEIFSEDKNSVTITKFDKVLNKEIRKYKITLSLKEKTSNVIIAEVEDKLEELETEMSGTRTKLRNRTSKTERKLLSQEVCKNYSEIARVSEDEIDSLKIYKIKRFLNYRSNLIIYFALINNFLCAPLKNEGITEIWKMSKDESLLLDKRLEKITDHVFNTLSKEIGNRINQLNKRISKNNIEIEELEIPCNHNNKRKSGQLEVMNKSLANKISELSGYSSKENLKQDLKKIIDIFSEFRHALMHYDYMYFENVFENRDCDKLKNLLDLNFFKYTRLIEEFKVENKTNYLDGEEKLSILGKSKNLKKLYSYYNTLCNNKSGFNKFINTFFTYDGIEDTDFKKLIVENFKNEMNIMKGVSKKNSLTTKNLNRMESHLKLMKDTPYFWDIHTSEIYKKLYSKRKNLIEQYNKEINGIRSNTSITKINSELLELKKQMEEITKNNALFRLKYKLQIAYAFLMVEFDGDLNSFKNNFNPTNLEEIQKYLSKEKKEYYLNFKIQKLQKMEKSIFDLGKLENQLKELQEKINRKNSLYLDVNSKNNLFKFYILNYLLLPVEFKGDFLGFVKTHYYNIKNVDFLDESDDSLTDEELNGKLKELSDDGFFHKIRLFEKNIKNYEVIKYSISTNESMKKYFELLELNVKHLEYKSTDEVGIFNKNMLLPIFKYYQNVFKLYNDIEIHGLLKLNPDLENSLKTIEELSGEGHINYRIIINSLKNKIQAHSLKKKVKEIEIRNSIAHLNYEKLFVSLFEKELNLNKNIRRIIEFSLDNELNKVDLGMDFINDYYMKKQRFIFNQRRLVPRDIIDSKRDLKKKQNDELMKKYRLNINFEDLNKIYDRATKLRSIADGDESIDQNKKLFDSIKVDNIPFLTLKEEIKNKILIKDSSDLMGVYKEQVVKKLKKKIIEKFIYDEEKIITINIYKTLTRETDSFIIKLKRAKDSDVYSFDEKSIIENEYYLCTQNSGVVTVIPKHSIKNIEFKFDLRSGYVFGKTIVYGTK
ncbi:MAG: type VI-C CRISPR-associated RNA-guided ribonuclease Cas13c [Cetobacterium sp.]